MVPPITAKTDDAGACLASEAISLHLQAGSSLNATRQSGSGESATRQKIFSFPESVLLTVDLQTECAVYIQITSRFRRPQTALKWYCSCIGAACSSAEMQYAVDMMISTAVVIPQLGPIAVKRCPSDSPMFDLSLAVICSSNLVGPCNWCCVKIVVALRAY